MRIFKLGIWDGEFCFASSLTVKLKKLHTLLQAGDSRDDLRLREKLLNALDDFVHVPEPPESFVAAGENSFFGADESDAAGFEFCDVFLRGGMMPHFPVHGGRDDERRGRSEHDFGKRAVSETVREFGDNVGGGGRDEDEIGVVGELDVLRSPAFALVEDAGENGILGKRLERERRDELLRAVGHDDENFVSAFAKLADEIGGFIRGDGTGDADDDTFGILHFKNSN